MHPVRWSSDTGVVSSNGAKAFPKDELSSAILLVPYLLSDPMVWAFLHNTVLPAQAGWVGWKVQVVVGLL